MRTILLALLLTYGIANYGQNVGNDVNGYKNTVFVEAFGTGFYGSLNYERQLTPTPHFTARLGLGFYTESNFYLTLPASLHYLIELGKTSYFETGFGYTWAQTSQDDCVFCDEADEVKNISNVFLSIGFRKHFGQGWMWKCNFTPLITNNQGGGFTPWMGLALGKRF